MPPDGDLGRSEFQGYVERHESDQYAHAAMRHTLRNELLGDALMLQRRLSALEAWQNRVIGALAMLSFLIVSGIIATVVELIRLNSR